MRTEMKEVYKCDHCNKLYQRKNACKYHEKICKQNKENIRACHSCVILEKVKHTVWSGCGDPWGNEMEIDVDILYCRKKDSFIYPPSVGIKGNAYETGDKFNIEMPKECDLQEGYDSITDY